MNLNHLHDSFFTDISLLILYEVFVTFKKIGKNIQLKKKFFFEKFRGDLTSRLAYLETFRKNLILR